MVTRQRKTGHVNVVIVCISPSVSIAKTYKYLFSSIFCCLFSCSSISCSRIRTNGWMTAVWCCSSIQHLEKKLFGFLSNLNCILKSSSAVDSPIWKQGVNGPLCFLVRLPYRIIQHRTCFIVKPTRRWTDFQQLHLLQYRSKPCKNPSTMVNYPFCLKIVWPRICCCSS